MALFILLPVDFVPLVEPLAHLIKNRLRQGSEGFEIASVPPEVGLCHDDDCNTTGLDAHTPFNAPSPS